VKKRASVLFKLFLVTFDQTFYILGSHRKHNQIQDNNNIVIDIGIANNMKVRKFKLNSGYFLSKYPLIKIFLL
jgi:hypothetical protein